MSESATSQRLGRFVETPVAGEMVRAFVPPALPPLPPIDILGLLDRLSHAERVPGRLDGITMLLPRQELFLYMYVRKEAVLSSQIEGTQSTGRKRGRVFGYRSYLAILSEGTDPLSANA
ncbi:Fic/DOC family N-terminal domain-containing protein [Silvimonas sp.]|uniref:Fic/DOC family N-terminal domain-containing protein n=1 Tax=Silvimonas sp. TaxID=2650811 RepID=UPI0028496F7A|nr:Fic/DOC family N-terminal domain-containing protein [Silvimonas sp.]MDR3427889.1 Fic/DOC family N-terminal domain-containing protein [Silvimonas sp.]